MEEEGSVFFLSLLFFVLPFFFVFVLASQRYKYYSRTSPTLYSFLQKERKKKEIPIQPKQRQIESFEQDQQLNQH